MVLSKEKKTLLLGLVCLCVIGVGMIPFFTPPYIFDYSHINWNGADLSEGVIGDHTYFNNFPNFTQPTHLNVYDVRGLPYEQQLVLTTLQGLVNKANTSLYLIYRSSDQFWLDRLHDYYGVNYTNLNNETYWQIIERYNSSIKGVIIYDQNFLDSVNVATFLAGLNECVVVHPNMVNNFSSLLGLSAFYDFRGNYTSRVELYTWAFENFWPLANQKMIASRPPDKVYFRDYIVAASPPIFTFWLEVGPFGNLEEVKLFRRIIAETPANIPVWGWFTDPGGAAGEYEAVKAISHSGKYSFCAAIPDLTVLSAFSDPLLTQKPVSFNASSYPLENKVYLACTVSDGDNVDYVSNFLRTNIWQSPDRGTVPVGITLEPLMARISPVILRYYYENATSNEYFLAGPSGAGYCYVDMNPSFPDYLNTTKYAMDQSDMRQVWLLNGYEGYMPIYSTEVLNAYTSPNCNFSGIYLDYHDFQAESNVLMNGVPVFHSMWVERENEILGKLNSIALTSPDQPVFVWIAYNSWDFDFTAIKNVFDALPNDTYTFLRPDQFAELFKHYEEEIKTEGWLNETSVLILTTIFLVIGVLALSFIWLFHKTRVDNEMEETAHRNSSFRSLFKVFYVVLDLAFLLVVNICFYSTILSAIYLFLLLIFIIIGIYLRKPLEKAIGIKETLLLSIGLGALGLVLFAIDPQFIIILSFTFGILISRQMQSNHLLFKSSDLGKRSFLYSMLIATAVLLLVPYQFYPLLIWIVAGIFIVLAGVIIISLKESHLAYFGNFTGNISHWYLKGIAFGLLLIFLLNPLFAPERFFFHVFWGLENFPTRLALGFTIAAIYMYSILLFEILRIKNVKFSRIIVVSLLGAGIFCYLVMPFLLQNVFIFLLSFFLFITGFIALIDISFIRALQFSQFQDVRDDLSVSSRGHSGFISQSLFWVIIGLFLFYIPPTIIVVDAQAIFELLGLTGIQQLSWSPMFWTLFYSPAIYMVLVVPITVFVLIFGISKTLIG